MAKKKSSDYISTEQFMLAFAAVVGIAVICTIIFTVKLNMTQIEPTSAQQTAPYR